MQIIEYTRLLSMQIIEITNYREYKLSRIQIIDYANY